jgi:formate/nitrite transporter FocA (FNT family)
MPEGVFRPEIVSALRELSSEPVQGHFPPTVLRAMFAGWLIAMMVWLLPSARSARLITVLLLTYVVAVGRLSHVIAGSVEAAYAVLAGVAPLQDYVMRFLLPTLIGNTLGGVSLVALLNHAAIAPEVRGTAEAAD